MNLIDSNLRPCSSQKMWFRIFHNSLHLCTRWRLKLICLIHIRNMYENTCLMLWTVFQMDFFRMPCSFISEMSNFFLLKACVLWKEVRFISSNSVAYSRQRIQSVKVAEILTITCWETSITSIWWFWYLFRYIKKEHKVRNP